MVHLLKMTYHIENSTKYEICAAIQFSHAHKLCTEEIICQITQVYDKNDEWQKCGNGIRSSLLAVQIR